VIGSPASLANHFATFGAGDSPNAGGVLAQSFATVLGQTYVVSFDLAVFGIAGSQTLNAQVQDLDHATTIADHDFTVFTDDNLDTAFGAHGFAFTATGTQARLAFRNTSAATNSIDLVLDNASVLARGAAPEPQAWALLLLGFGLMGTAVRRRAAATAAL
jgi:hypothetical protein